MSKSWVSMLLIFVGLTFLAVGEAESGSTPAWAVQFKTRAAVQKESIFLAL